MLELYQFEECPYCRRVRTKMTDLELTYIIHNVPRDHDKRDELEKLTGQRSVPVLIDKDRKDQSGNPVIIADDDEAIIAYLEKYYS